MCAVRFSGPEPPPRKSPDIIMVGGGKGGVGESCFPVNLSVAVAARGWRVILLDADLSFANAETGKYRGQNAIVDANFRRAIGLRTGEIPRP